MKKSFLILPAMIALLSFSYANNDRINEVSSDGLLLAQKKPQEPQDSRNQKRPQIPQKQLAQKKPQEPQDSRNQKRPQIPQKQLAQQKPRLPQQHQQPQLT